MTMITWGKMLNNFADNVYVLNLEEESFKYEILKRKLDKKGIEHERFIATPATKYWRMPNNLTKLVRLLSRRNLL